MSTDYSGMTLNERLYKADLMAAFDSAVRKQDRNRLAEILKRVALEGEDAVYIIDTVLNDPKRYGH